jgi:AcrR family transcriptional regulator
MVQNQPRPQGRPPKFDRDTTAAQLQHVFWRRGYAGVSLDDLARATGLHKPSLYGAFGDKRQMYLGALHAYLEANAERFRAAMAVPGLRESLSDFYAGSIAVFARHADAPGCFLLATAAPMAAEDSEVGEIFANAIHGIDRLIERRLARAIAEGDLADTTDLRLATDLVVGTHFSLSARARAGAETATLEDQAARFVDYMCKSFPH